MAFIQRPESDGNVQNLTRAGENRKLPKTAAKNLCPFTFPAGKAQETKSAKRRSGMIAMAHIQPHFQRGQDPDERGTHVRG